MKALGAIIDHKQFTVVCSNKDVLHTALVMMNMVRGNPVSLPLPNRYVMAFRLPVCTNFSYTIICMYVHVGHMD